jgi:multidrug efflux pump subunit AcrA (membrane-fusion protein)
MDLSSRKTLVEIYEDRGEQDNLLNPILSKVGSFYARAVYPTPKDAIATGTLAVVQYVQLFFLATDSERLGIKSSQKAKINGKDYEINGEPYQVFEGNRLYVCMNVSRKVDNG